MVLSKRMTIVAAIVTGVGLELGIHALSGRREAWDSPLYWTAGLPAAGAICVALGFLSRRSDWLWSFLVVPAQVGTMMVGSGEIGSLWPLALIFSTLLSTPFVFLAFVGSRLRSKA